MLEIRYLRSFAVNRLFAAPLLFGFVSLVSAQTAPTVSKVGVIQVQAALAATKDGKVALEEMDKRLLQPKRKDIEAKQADLKDVQDKLQRGGNTLSQAAKEDMQRQIDVKTTRLNRDMQDAQQELEEEQQKVVGDLMQKMGPIVEKYAQDNGFTLILDVSDPARSGVFWAATAVDITQAVVDLYDKTAPAAAPAAAKPITSGVKAPTAAPKPPAAPKPAPAK
jgi:outer membrane protein